MSGFTIRKFDFRLASRFPIPARRNPVTVSSSPMTANRDPSEDDAATAAALDAVVADISSIYV